MEHNPVLERNEVLLNATIWINLENIMLSKLRQTQKDKYMISLTCNTKIRQIHRNRKYNKGRQGLGEEGMESYCFVGTDFGLG